MAGLSVPSRNSLLDAFGANLVELSEADAAIYAANSFQLQHEGRLYLFMPRGISDQLTRAVQERGVEPVTTDVSEFLAKGGGSIKCMILDLGAAAEQPVTADSAAFRVERSYRRLFGS
jgi:N-dimethylarginine dimethylaminohydrolase